MPGRREEGTFFNTNKIKSRALGRIASNSELFYTTVKIDILKSQGLVPNDLHKLL